ncbi:RhoGAP domain containing protein [Histomonas meleagridis]|uniref:RhoGAP domain containing protein n=1 Tax=Histomonas meleagridis TaxID=135588 RepID=UPI00355ABD78|nr:RhoGAP domain containing protein [Histomonas meleagridis]KAH0805695.1 RhoGAP domain containing protein [Histomonas meleagridis]
MSINKAFSNFPSIFKRNETQPEPTPEPEKKEETIFGMDIHLLPVNDNGCPIFLPIVIDEIIKNANVQGLFRICGSHRVVQEIGHAALDPVKFVPPPDCHIHEYTSFLKQWLRSLPEPILTTEVVNTYYRKDDPKSVSETLMLLDPLNRRCIALIFKALKAILSKSSVNMMTFQNLDICFNLSFLQTDSPYQYKDDFDFEFFYSTLIKKLNKDGTDFIFDII